MIQAGAAFVEAHRGFTREFDVTELALDPDEPLCPSASTGQDLRAAAHSATTKTMTGTSTKLTAAVETYFAELGRMRASGGATGERSSYAPLAKLRKMLHTLPSPSRTASTTW